MKINDQASCGYWFSSIFIDFQWLLLIFLVLFQLQQKNIMHKRFAFFMMKAKEFKGNFELFEPIFLWWLQDTTRYTLNRISFFFYPVERLLLSHQGCLFTARDFLFQDKWFSCRHSKSTLSNLWLLSLSVWHRCII